MNLIIATARERRQEQLDTGESSATKPTGSDAGLIDSNDNVVKTSADRNEQKNKKKLKSNGHLKQFETTSSSKTKKLTKTQTNGFRKNNGITQDGGSARTSNRGWTVRWNLRIRRIRHVIESHVITTSFDT